MKSNAKLTYECGLPDSFFSMKDGQEFCSQCRTSIVDFTEMSDDEIRAYVSAQAGSFCVKIHSDQLQRVKGQKIYAASESGSGSNGCVTCSSK